jgi:hypothetical protein
MNKFAHTTPWLTIRTGEHFDLLPVDQQRAVLAHERGHLKHRHSWKRIWWLITHSLGKKGAYDAFWGYCAEQELEADSYARDIGHGPALARFIVEHVRMTATGYPSVIRRLENLRE